MRINMPQRRHKQKISNRRESCGPCRSARFSGANDIGRGRRGRAGRTGIGPAAAISAMTARLRRAISASRRPPGARCAARPPRWRDRRQARRLRRSAPGAAPNADIWRQDIHLGQRDIGRFGLIRSNSPDGRTSPFRNVTATPAMAAFFARHLKVRRGNGGGSVVPRSAKSESDRPRPRPRIRTGRRARPAQPRPGFRFRGAGPACRG